jgi:hypothetical protein
MSEDAVTPNRARWWDLVLTHAEALSTAPTTEPAESADSTDFEVQDPWRDVEIDAVQLSPQQQDFLGSDQPRPSRLGSLFADDPAVDDA